MTTAKDTREQSIGWIIKSLSRKLDQRMKIELSTHEITVEQFSILMILMENEGVSQSVIGEKISMPRYSITRNIDYLENKKFLKRHPDSHSKRSLCIFLTPKGKELGPRLFAIVGKVNEELLSPLAKKDAIKLKALLNEALRGF